MKFFFPSLIAGLAIFAVFAVTRSADNTPPAPSPKLISLGKQIYGEQCAACHGATGRGERASNS